MDHSNHECLAVSTGWSPDLPPANGQEFAQLLVHLGACNPFGAGYSIGYTDIVGLIKEILE